MKILVFLVILIGCGVLIAGCSGKRPTNLGVKNGLLNPCPNSPNCVISQGDDEKHNIAPLSYTVTREKAFQDLKQIVQTHKRTKVIEEKDDYLRAEFKTLIMRYVDDIEFYFPDEQVIHVRSASRLGYHDMGLNRRRIEKIRRLFSERK